MKRTAGISRNKLQTLQLAKNGLNRKKNIFKFIGKDQELSEDLGNNTNHLLSATTKHSAHSIDTVDTNPALQIYQEAKNHLHQVAEYRKKMAAEIKLRMSAFKDSQIKVYDDNIAKYSHKAVDHLLKSQKILSSIKKLRSHNDTEEKFFRNMERSLALEIRQVSKGLRTQEKDYFDKIKSFQSGAVNPDLILQQKDREKMKDDFEDMEVCETEMGEDQERNRQITQLVRSINDLAKVYKQMSELVIEQGSIIDRIDYNIEQTVGHVGRGVKHLENAEKHASNTCATKCMCILVILIVAMACVMGFKMAN